MITARYNETKDDFNISTLLEIHITHNNEMAIIEPAPERGSNWWGYKTIAKQMTAQLLACPLLSFIVKKN